MPNVPVLGPVTWAENESRMYELLWMLLPVAAAGGWLAGRRYAMTTGPDRFWNDATTYHRDLHSLLSETAADSAPDDTLALGSPVSVEQDAAETHIALGNMFRRRGDLDSAIRIHASLTRKNQLGEDVRSEAQLELARDYDSAGLLDRSEAQFRALLKANRQVDASYEHLLQISERASDWQRAIQTADEFQNSTGRNLGSRIAHYYCEIAESLIAAETTNGLNADKAAGGTEDAERWLENALKRDPACARASIRLAELAVGEKNFSEAIDLYERVEQQRPELMPEIISPLFESLEQLGDETRLRAYIDRIKGRLNAYSVIKTTRNMIERMDGENAADEFFKDQIVKRPSLKGLRDWARGQLEKSRPNERGKVGVMCDMLDQVVKDKPGYVCSECGFRGQTRHWRCPGCNRWDTVHTVIGAEGE